MAGVLGSAASGLIAIQRAISTTGHNISNANTEGYTKQRVEFGTRPPEFTGAGYIGNGVQIQSIDRLYDKFLTDNLRSTTSSSTQSSTFAELSERVSNIIGDSDAGMSAVLGSFFNSIQAVADDPASIPARQTMMTEAETLVGRFHSVDRQMDSIRTEINQGLTGAVSEINSLTTSIAQSNRQIIDAKSLAGGDAPNDLMDKRDMMVSRLSELVEVKTVEQGDGAVNVFIGSGQGLVTRFLASELETLPNAYDANRLEVAIKTGGESSVITQSLSGGRLGAILDFGEQVLDSTQNSLGRIAVTLSTEINNQQSLGMDLNNSIGRALFSSPQPVVAANQNNLGSAAVTATFDSDNLDQLSTRDYLLEYDGSNWGIEDASTGELFAMSGSGSLGSPFKFDGLEVVVSAGASAGDQYQIRPTRNIGAEISLLTNDAKEIAAAAPARISEQVDATGAPLNTGNGSMTLKSIDSDFVSLGAAIQIAFDSSTNQFNYSGPVSGSFSYDPSTDSGSNFTVNGVSFTVKGAPSNGDSFSLAANTDGSGDNTNALALADLQTGLTMEGGKASFSDAYLQLVGDVGTRTRTSQITADAQLALQRQAQETRDNKSGVNLDEEAANLLRFQQAYQALAQVISVANETFQTLLGAVGR